MKVTRTRKLCVTAGAALLIAASCARPLQQIDQQAYANEIEQWRAKRLASLTSDSGWLTLIGLYWLDEGENRFGNDPGNAIIWPRTIPGAFGGAFVVKSGVVRLEASASAGFTVDGQPVTNLELKSDADGNPTILRIGTISFQIIKRNDKFALRVKDSQNPDRSNFRGLEYFPTNPKWRINARFEPYNPPRPIPILNVLNMETDEPSPGAIAFEVDGKPYRLDAITEKGNPQFFMIFADDTRGKDTYGAGRYLYVDPPDANNRIVIDFNKAHSPPCAFTNFATCPLPPTQNILPVAIEAGEKFKGH